MEMKLAFYLGRGTLVLAISASLFYTKQREIHSTRLKLVVSFCYVHQAKFEAGIIRVHIGFLVMKLLIEFRSVACF